MTLLESPWQHDFLETNHIRLHCVMQGEGELVLLLHGFPEFWYSWRYQITPLARYFKVVVPDLRGYNDSDKPETGYDLDTLSADILGLIESLGYKTAAIVGHDWGGIIAWHFAQKFPESVHRLVILNAPQPQYFVRELVSNLDQFRRGWFVFAFQIPGIPEWLIENNLKEFVKNIMQGYAVRKGAFSADETRLYEEALQKPGVLRAILNYYRQLFQPHWFWHWGQKPEPIRVPTLVLWGQEDVFLCQKFTEHLDELIAAPYQLKLIPNCGHWIQLEAAQTVNRELLMFLRGESSFS